MSLNDEALSELNDDADYLTDGNSKDTIKDTIVVACDNKVDLDVPDDIDAAVSALDGYDVELQTSKDDVVKVTALDDLANTVLAQETISQADAEEVERVYGGLYENVASQKEFTQTPTSVNLKETQQYVEATLEATKTAAINRHKEYLVKTYDHATCLLKCLNEKLLPELLDELAKLREQSTADLAKASVSKNFLVYTKELKNDAGQVTSSPRLIDLKNSMLFCDIKEQYDIPASLRSLPSKDDIEMLREVFYGVVFKRLMSVSKITTDILASLHREYHSLSDGDRTYYDLTYIDILSIYVSGRIESYITEAFAALNQLAEKIVEVVPKFIASEDGSEDQEQRWSESALEVSDFYERLMQAEKLCMTVYMFNYRAKPILEGFGKAL